jgi:hypothetical protein
MREECLGWGMLGACLGHSWGKLWGKDGMHFQSCFGRLITPNHFSDGNTSMIHITTTIMLGGCLGDSWGCLQIAWWILGDCLGECLGNALGMLGRCLVVLGGSLGNAWECLGILE